MIPEHEPLIPKPGPEIRNPNVLGSNFIMKKKPHRLHPKLKPGGAVLPVGSWTSIRNLKSGFWMIARNPNSGPWMIATHLKP